MPCYYPIDGWRSRQPNDNGKYPIVFSKAEAQLDAECTIACGRCLGCRLEKSRQTAMRCMFEADSHDQNSFITLTYADEHLPRDWSVNKKDWQLFAKRLRKKTGVRMRFFGCGEYGENQNPFSLDTIGRPHYHAIIFGYDFPDRIEIEPSKSGERQYMSKILDEAWGKGRHSIGELTFESAAYVARYTVKKIGGEEADEYYEWTDFATGESIQREPEFGIWPRGTGKEEDRGTCWYRGLGYQWFEKYRKDLDKGYVTVKGVKLPPPKYYLDKYKTLYEEEYQETELRNKKGQYDPYDTETDADRLRVKEELKIRQTKSLRRKL